MGWKALQARLARGWNTWDTRSVLSHVLLPDGLSIGLGLFDVDSAQHLRSAVVTRHDQGEARVTPGPHSYGGAYTELTLAWQKQKVCVRTALDGADWVALVTPLDTRSPLFLVAEGGVLWSRPGAVSREGDTLCAVLSARTIVVHATSRHAGFLPVDARGPYLSLSLEQPVGLSTGRARTVEEIRRIVDAARAEHEKLSLRYGAEAEVHRAVHACLGWDTIYDPEGDRVITPVSREWNVGWWGGWVLFCWDTYFAAYMLSLDDKDLAYANAIAITREVRHCGFVPNFASAFGLKSFDRSQPPVGSLVVRAIYARHQETWLLEETFDDLLTWNRWWAAKRSKDGYLAWGSNAIGPTPRSFGRMGVHERLGAALESGLDNSPMYDDTPFDPEGSILLLADVGLMGMYVLDCEILAELAEVLGRAAELAELTLRAEAYRDRLRTLWDDRTGIFCNKRLDTGAFEHRLSPTNFYALLAGAATAAQARRMMDEHFFNPAELAGEHILPSIARSDPAYPEQKYWRGRIWAPMNFLVYLGLLRYDLPEARRELADKSRALLLREWRERGHVHENYCADTGAGCNSTSSDAFYHWGGLLGTIALIESGIIPPPVTPAA